MQSKPLLCQEQMRVELQRLRHDLHEYFAGHERAVRVAYSGLCGRLDRLQRAVSAGDGCGCGSPGAAAAALPAGGGAALATPVAPHGPPAPPAPSTPPAARLRAGAGDRADWTALTLSLRRNATPPASPQRPWQEEARAADAAPGGLPVDYEGLDRLIEEDSAMGERMDGTTIDAPSSARFTADEQQQEQHSLSYAKPDLIPIGTLSAQQNQHFTTSLKVSYVNGRPQAVPILDGVPDDPVKLGVETHAQCKVLVEFKRKRVLQFESKEYVAPGSYVMVGGDRGEDLGLVTYTWCETTRAADSGDADGGANGKSAVLAVGLSGSTFTRNIGHGTGVVLRSASEKDVVQLHEVQSELEQRAVDVCSQRVLEHVLPMTIVDAEYQFDKKKLTFFFEARQRMDFRELVRDLYKTFRARIWMEPVES